MNPDQPGWSPSLDAADLLQRAAEISAEILREAASGDVTTPLPGELLNALRSAPLPRAGAPAQDVLADIARDLAPHPMGNGHPRFLAWVNSPPHPLGVAAAAIANAMNPSVAGGRHAAVHVEHEVVRWFLELLGWAPPQSHGLLTSGGSAATLTALGAARHHAYARAGLDDRRDGLAGARPTVYATSEAHSCVVKAVEALGIGSANIRRVPADDDRMRPADLARMLADDRATGHLPVAVVASVGTVNTGAIDPIGEIADVCAEHDVWLHVDGAYGGPAALFLDEYADVRADLARVDSLGLDPHKWLYVPVDAGLVLFRDATAARTAYSLVPPYLFTEPSPEEPVWFSEYGLEQTRPFRALKLWAQLRHLGADGYRELIGRDIAVAEALRHALEAADDFEVLASGLSVVCFRHLAPGLDDAGQDAHNRALATSLQLGGEVFLASTTVGERMALRACVVNPLTTTRDIPEILASIRRAAEISMRGWG